MFVTKAHSKKNPSIEMYTIEKLTKKTFRMSIYMLNKIPTELEILASKVDISTAKKERHFPQSFHFEGSCQKSGGLQRVSCWVLFLVGVWTFEQKSKKSWFGRITSWPFCHPFSHCALLCKLLDAFFQFIDNEKLNSISVFLQHWIFFQ